MIPHFSLTVLPIYVDDFILVVTSPSLATNVDKLEDRYRSIAKVFCKLGLAVKLSKTELMHFTAKNVSTKCGHKPLQFPVPFSSLTYVELHPLAINEPIFLIAPSKEWRYLGFFFDPLLSFHSHVTRYTNKALTTVNNLHILGHSYEGLTPWLRKQVYMSVVWSVMSYGLPLWFRLNGKGAKLLMAKFQVVQNRAACWIMGAFRTTPTAHVEYLTGLPTVVECANVILCSAML